MHKSQRTTQQRRTKTTNNKKGSGCTKNYI